LRRRPRTLERCFSIEDLRSLARRRLPVPIFHYLDGGADDEASLRRNTEAFGDYEFQAQCLVDVSSIDTGTTLLGKRIDVPFIIAPTGMSRLFHHAAELAVARAAARVGTFYSLSTLGSTSLEDVAAATPGPKIFQIYVLKDRELTREFVTRCKAARYDALCLTIDTPVAGNRERDRVTGMAMPPRFTTRSLLDFARRPRWALDLLLHPGFQLANVAHRVDAIGGSLVSVIDYVNGQMDRSLNWRDVEWLASQWSGPLILKGVQSVRDAERAIGSGITALMLSNHGGRQLDGAIAPIDLVRDVRAAVGDRLEIIVDGGVRRGSHVLKALALGANACSIGRSYLYGLAAGGERGVDRALTLLRSEVERDLALLGCRSPAELGAHHVRYRGSRPERRLTP
jgi:L-lactate dehydrogenase (cytochrome)